MNAFETYTSLVNTFTLEMKIYENTKKYINEINIFSGYLKKFGLEGNVFKLSRDNIDNYIAYCIQEEYIGTKSTLNTHLSALKELFDHLINNNYNFDEHLGYITSDIFRTKTMALLEESKRKEVISVSSLQAILHSIDECLDNNLEVNKNYLTVSFVRVFIKLSLILPLKATEMLSINFNCFDEEFRHVEYNGIKLRLPNSLRKNIIDIVNIVVKMRGENFKKTDSLFAFICQPITTSSIKTSKISHWFYSTLKALGFADLLQNSKKTFSVERFKKTAIVNLLNSNANILFLCRLTGLTLEALASEYSVDDHLEEASKSINASLFQSQYYSYL